MYSWTSIDNIVGKGKNLYKTIKWRRL